MEENQSLWKKKILETEKRLEEVNSQQVQTKDDIIKDLEDQVRDLMFYIEAQNKLANNNADFRDGQVVVVPAPSSPASHSAKKIASNTSNNNYSPTKSSPHSAKNSSSNSVDESNSALPKTKEKARVIADITSDDVVPSSNDVVPEASAAAGATPSGKKKRRGGKKRKKKAQDASPSPAIKDEGERTLDDSELDGSESE